MHSHHAKVLALALLFGGSALCATREEKPVNVEELRSAIARELPVGATRAQVEAFLDARHISHSYMETERTVFASTQEERVNAFTLRAVYMQFHFDDARKMRDYSIKEVFTGP